MSRVEFLIQVLRRLLGEAGASGASGARMTAPVSLQVSLIVQQIGREQPFTSNIHVAADRLAALSLNLELALDEGRPLDSPRAAALDALEQFARALDTASR